MNAIEFCDIAGADKNDRFVIVKKYGNVKGSLDDWKAIVKNDFRSIVFPVIEKEVEQEAKVQKTNKKENK